jgi:hypothetical protein
VKVQKYGESLELIRKHLENSSRQNRDIDELEGRKNCLSYLNKLGRKLRGAVITNLGVNGSNN